DHKVVRAGTQRRPLVPVPPRDVVDGEVARVRELAARDDLVPAVDGDHLDGRVDTGAQRRPRRAVPPGDVVGRAPAGLGEAAAGKQVAVQHGDGGDGVVGA